MFQLAIQKFLEKKSDKKKLIVIYGPTASGKTDMSIDIARQLNTEIISTDSRQLFRGMDIGTGKITQEETQGVVHHMIDILEPNARFSMGEFVADAEAVMQRLWNEEKIPMLVGGTGLYIDSLIFQRNGSDIPANPELRAEFDCLNNDELYTKLMDIDPDYAQEIHPNNRPYVERALEVKLMTGKSKSEFRSERILKYDVLFLNAGYKHPSFDGSQEFIFSPEYRSWLYERINLRVHQMMNAGLPEEVEYLLSRGYSFTDFGMNSIGYREFQEYFDGLIDIQEVESRIAQYSRNYAKRQLTWFKRYIPFINN